MRVLFVASFVAALMLAGCSGNSNTSSSSSSTGTVMPPVMDHSPKTYQISMQNNAFSNASLMIKTGDQVTWTHNDGPTTAHTVTTDSGAPEAFDSNPNCVAPIPVNQGPATICMTGGNTFSYVFQKDGSYGIHCKIHANMKMTVMVMPHNMTMPA